MLTHALNLISTGKPEPAYFEKYKTLAEELCRHLAATEGIQAKAFSSQQEEFELLENFLSYPLEVQKQKFENFLQYYNHCFEMATKNISLRNRFESLKCFTYMYGLHFPSEQEVYSVIHENSYVEIYDLNFTQRYRTADWLETTTHSLMAVETLDWRNLFFRSQVKLQEQIDLVGGIFNSKIRQPIYKPLEIHTVKEIKSKAPLCAELESLMYAPVLDQNERTVGIIHILRVNNLRSLDFKILENTH